MEFIQSLLESSSIPVVTAFLLGILTAISPCPLATNITAIGYISKDIESKHRIFWGGILYTAGRIITYTALGFILIRQQIRRNADRSGTDPDRIVYAVRKPIEFAEVRVRRQWQ